METFGNEIILGILVGLILSLETFLCNLPQDRFKLLISLICLIFVVGEIWKIILIVGVASITKSVLASSDPALDHLGDFFVGICAQSYARFKSFFMQTTGQDISEITENGSVHLNNFKNKVNESFSLASNKIEQLKIPFSREGKEPGIKQKDRKAF